MAEVRRTLGLAVGAAGVGVTAGALLLPDSAPGKPVAAAALVVGLAAAVVIVLVIGLLVTIPSDRRTANLVRVIRAIKGNAGPPEPPSDQPADGGHPLVPRPDGDREALAVPDRGRDEAVAEPEPPMGRLGRPKWPLRGRVFPSELDSRWRN